MVQLHEVYSNMKFDKMEGNTFLHFHLTVAPDLFCIRQLLKSNHKADVNTQNDLGGTPFHACCMHHGAGAIGRVEAFMKAGADPYIANHEGETPYDLAAEFMKKRIEQLHMKYEKNRLTRMVEAKGKKAATMKI